MKQKEKQRLFSGVLMIVLFMIWTGLIRTVDVQPVGVNGTEIGFAKVNMWFHELTGVHMWIYSITDWLGLIPVMVCLSFGVMGFMQLVKRRSIMEVDYDICLLGIYYLLVIFGYLFFEMIPINYRPILIEGRLEASYPSSTTLLVFSVMLSLRFQVQQRVQSEKWKKIIICLVSGFTFLVVVGRLVSGVHWMTDIIGSVLLSVGMFWIYQALVLGYKKKKVEEIS